MMPTIFAKIIRKEIPAHIVYEDDLVLAFLDISQATQGHTLIVPKANYKNIFELDAHVTCHMFLVAQKLSIALSKAFETPHINIISNNGSLAGQTVFHFHIHLIPRYEENDITLQFKNHMSELSSDIYKERATKIKEALS